MTEDEAKTKWCPFNRITSEGPSGDLHNNRGTAQYNPECIASACMAWRWVGYRASDGTWVRKAAVGPWKRENADGYCGLAGTPQ